MVVDDLVGTGLFREIPRSAHIGRISNFDAPVQFADWKAINAQALITGAVGASGDKVAVRFRSVGRLRADRPRRRAAIPGPGGELAPAGRTRSPTRSIRG